MSGDQTTEETLGSESGKSRKPSERKRRAARRRFLVGGAASLPLIYSVSRKALATGGKDDDMDDMGMGKKKKKRNTLCMTMLVNKKKKVKDPITKEKIKKIKFSSLVCKVKKDHMMDS